MNNYNYVSLHVKCPTCGVSLMDSEIKVDNEPSIRLLINESTHNGTIRLSAIYGSYNLISEIPLTEKAIAVFSCPHCSAEITSKEICSTCSAPLASLVLDMGGKISFCTRTGCVNHNVGFDDSSDEMQKLHQEFGYHIHHISDKRITPENQ